MTSCNYTRDMFDINGKDKLSGQAIAAREEIIAHYAKDPKCLFVISHSAGKDSSAQYSVIKRLVSDAQIVVVHAHLDGVEHDGVIEHIERNISEPLHVVRGNTSFVDLTISRSMFPSPRYRNCTSTLKTAPIDAFIRKLSKERGANVIFNCVGLRSDESAMRKMKSPLFLNKRLTTKSRTVFDLYPIFHFSEDDVYNEIETSGQTLHPAYGDRGDKYSRLSCIFCIMSNSQNLIQGAKMHPNHYAEIIALEHVISHTMFSKRVKGEVVKVSLEDKTGIKADPILVKQHESYLRERQANLLAKKAIEKAERDALKARKKQLGSGKARPVCDNQTRLF